ncbi:MAG: AAC(3) family N-acetyltransferase [Ilumatobacteraceae bacterium]
MTARSAASITDDLRRLGVQAGDTLMIHASLRAVGPIDGGALGLIAALDEAVGPDGTLLMMIGADDPWSWVNERPERERAAALADATPFDTATTPAEPENGVLAEEFRTAPGTVVNDHPEGRFAARGARAAELIAGQPWDDYYGPGSPLQRLVDAGGTVLRLGSDLDTVTLLHYAEYLVDLPTKRRVTRHRRIATADGPVIRTISCLDDSDGIVERPADTEDYFATIARAALQAGLAVVGPVGDATAELLPARELIAFATAWMAEHLA